eukprot:1562230-Prymnesium_polylepis.2
MGCLAQAHVAWVGDSRAVLASAKKVRRTPQTPNQGLSSPRRQPLAPDTKPKPKPLPPSPPVLYLPSRLWRA